jgi:long-chain acyl-CoA synthetase
VPSPEIVASELDKLRDDLQSAVDRVNTQLSVGERIRKFIIQEDICSTENGLLTPTQKIKRAVVLNRNSERISELY